MSKFKFIVLDSLTVSILYINYYTYNINNWNNFETLNRTSFKICVVDEK